VAVASAEPYASYLHFALEDNRQHLISQWMPFLTPNQQRHSAEGHQSTEGRICNEFNEFV